MPLGDVARLETHLPGSRSRARRGRVRS